MENNILDLLVSLGLIVGFMILLFMFLWGMKELLWIFSGCGNLGDTTSDKVFYVFITLGILLTMILFYIIPIVIVSMSDDSIEMTPIVEADEVDQTPIVEADEVDQTPLEPATEIDKTLTYDVSYALDGDVWVKYYEVTIDIENFNVFDQNRIFVWSEGDFVSSAPVSNILKSKSSFLIKVDADSYDEIEITLYQGYLADETVTSTLYINETL